MATKYLTFVTWRHTEGAACVCAARKAIMVTCSLSAQTSRDVLFSRTCRDAACWGFVGETIWDFCLYCRPSAARTRRRRRGAFVKPPENGSHQSREAYAPSHNLHPQAMERDAARGDRDRQLTKNNMCLTQPRMGEKRGFREGTVDDAMEPLRICEPGRWRLLCVLP